MATPANVKKVNCSAVSEVIFNCAQTIKTPAISKPTNAT